MDNLGFTILYFFMMHKTSAMHHESNDADSKSIHIWQFDGTVTPTLQFVISILLIKSKSF